jgi:hypothetical protein
MGLDMATANSTTVGAKNGTRTSSECIMLAKSTFRGMSAGS